MRKQEPVETMRSQEESGGAKSSQESREEPGGARRARKSQHEPAGAGPPKAATTTDDNSDNNDDSCEQPTNQLYPDAREDLVGAWPGLSAGA